MPKETINITLDRGIWDSLGGFAREQSIKQGKRFPAIKALRLATKVFLRLEPREIKEVLKRDTRYCG